VTDDLQIVFSSNVLAVLGLRALYGVVERLGGRLRYFRYGIGAILVLIGAKMCLDRGVHVPAWATPAAPLGVPGFAGAASLVRRPQRATDPTPPSPARHAAPDAPACVPAPPAEAAGQS